VTRQEEAVLSVIRGAISRPGRFAETDPGEGIPAWQARAVVAAFAAIGGKITLREEPAAQAAEPDADLFPHTCEWCSNSPATHLLIADYRPEGRQAAERQETRVCGTCAHGTTVLPPCFVGWWLFALVPDDPFACKEAIS